MARDAIFGTGGGRRISAIGLTAAGLLFETSRMGASGALGRGSAARGIGVWLLCSRQLAKTLSRHATEVQASRRLRHAATSSGSIAPALSSCCCSAWMYSCLLRSIA
ncbi:hypothetical protein N234_00120 [Ralstonia pickettii DTP0602]|nr:hypothetical protein N234_00120 [Ralstonia pickettii DTP0602]